MIQKSGLGISGKVAAFFQESRLTPLFALLALLLGFFAVTITPREEEPQINVTMANVLIPFPGASTSDVEHMVSVPAEQVLSQMSGAEHVMTVSRPGMSIVTVQFKVGVPRTEALVRLHDTLRSNSDWLPRNLGVLEPIIKPKGIDDVPIVTLTLFSKDTQSGAFELERVANSIEVELKRVGGTREVQTIGGPGRAVMVKLDPAKMSRHNISVSDLRQALLSANQGVNVGELVYGNKTVSVDAGPYLINAAEVADLVVGVFNEKPTYLRDVAEVTDGEVPQVKYVWHGTTGNDAAEYPAVTITITKKPGENAIDIANAIIERVDNLKNTVIPSNIDVVESRNYGVTANDKAIKLIEKLIFATSCVVGLVFFALGKREAAIVGTAVVLTLTVTLFASWAYGFTLNRVSLFALIFSIGILVDDAIVVVENIHRHQQLYPSKNLLQIIPHAVDEVGGPTILATLTVIAALLPMAFVSGLMGPYMSPIPINASMGMILSLIIAFVVTPWLSRLWLKSHIDSQSIKTQKTRNLTKRIEPFFEKLFEPLLNDRDGSKNRKKLGLGIAASIILSLALPATGLVLLKMLPFDNKSEFQIIVDMPSGTPVEKTAAVLHDIGRYLKTIPEVTDYQAYAGTSGPINFNGLVRQYYLRSGGEVGDIQVNLVDKHNRNEQSHSIASRLRPDIQRIGLSYGANIKIVEVPPGPPVLSPLVAEIYGPEAKDRQVIAKSIRSIFEQTPNVVDVDDSTIYSSSKKFLIVDRQKASHSGITQQEIVSTLRAGLSGESVTYIHDNSKYATPVMIELPDESHGNIDNLLQLVVHANSGKLVPIKELVTISNISREQPIYHKDLLPVEYVTGDMAGKVDSPLYGMFQMRRKITNIETPGGGNLVEYFVHQPQDQFRNYSIKWDGEWQITYETFRDMGAAYAVGLVLIYLLVVAQFGSYLTPLIIMAPIPLTIIGVMPGHALLGSQYTATSMIGMIALAGIIVRNSILLVDFINLQVRAGEDFKNAIVKSAITRSQPIVLTGLAAMLGAIFILDDPIFNGLAISLIFGILVSTLLTLIVIPVLYYSAYKDRLDQINTDLI
jgi:multidrug efflux pump subunit AcrB